MKKRFQRKHGFLFFSLAPVLMAISSCDNFPSMGQDAVRKAYSAIRKDDLQVLRSALSGEALKQFGNSSGMRTLQERLLGREIEATPSQPDQAPVYNASNHPIGCFYSFTISDQKSPSIPLLDVQAFCELLYAKPQPKRDIMDPGRDCLKESILTFEVVRELCTLRSIHIE